VPNQDENDVPDMSAVLGVYDYDIYCLGIVRHELVILRPK
jgi:hypothetical protein